MTFQAKPSSHLGDARTVGAKPQRKKQAVPGKSETRRTSGGRASVLDLLSLARRQCQWYTQGQQEASMTKRRQWTSLLLVFIVGLGDVACTKRATRTVTRGTATATSVASPGSRAEVAVSVSQPEPQTTRPSPDPRSQQSTIGNPQSAIELAPGVPIERELAGGEVHTYRIALTSDQYLRVVVDQRGVDVGVKLFGPDGQQLAEVDSPNGTQGPEPVNLLTEAAGDYRLEVRALDKEAATGRYQVRIEERREATPQDRNRLTAERINEEVGQLFAQGTAESLRRAIDKLQEARLLWRAVGDQRGEAGVLLNIGRAYHWLVEPETALEYLSQALPLWRATGECGGEAAALNATGNIYYNLDEHQQALEYFNQAL
jgi:hypothetical protein